MYRRLRRPVAVLRESWSRANAHNINVAAAGVAYFGILALAPALAALVALYGLIGDPAAVQRQVHALGQVAPPDVISLADSLLTRLVAEETSVLAWSGVVSLAVSLWSANRGIDGFLKALGQVGPNAPQRSFVKQLVVSGAFTAAGVLAALVVIASLALIPAAIAFLPLTPGAERALAVVRWPILLAAAFGFAAALYRWGPPQGGPPWRAVWPAALFATLVWIAGSIGLSAYLSRFTAANEAYGPIAGVASALLWLFVTAFIFLFGGVISGVMAARHHQ